MDLNERHVLITGGTGSFGKRFVETVLKRYPEIKKLVIYSRDEYKQFEMSQHIPQYKGGPIRYFIGDVRDYDRLRRALEGIDTVIHAAALKQVPTAEYNPFECIKTNVLGAENLINACLDSGVKDVIALSTDKAAAPINLYGATKLCSDKLFVAANNIKGKRELKISVVRYGNVIGSRGSVVPFFLRMKKTGKLPITHEDMTRFSITLDEGVGMVLWALENHWGGEIFVPKIPSYRIMDVAEAIAPECDHEIVGIRPGEKLHEEMITESDSYNTVDLGDYYAIVPVSYRYTMEDYMKSKGAEMFISGNSYNSGNNTQWLGVSEIRALIRTHIEPTFEL